MVDTALQQLESLIQELDTSPDNAERRRMFKAVGPIIDLHRDALRRILETLRREGRADMIDRLMEDPLLESLLRGYELVELDLTIKVKAALENARPLLQKHGGDVRLLEVREQIAHLELTGSCHGCASSLVTLKNGIEKALYENVPELRGVEVAGLTQPTSKRNLAKWLPLVHWSEIKDGEWLKVKVFDDDVLVFTVDGRPFVFQNRCPAGTRGLEDALFDHLSIACACHGHKFDLRTGGCVDVPSLRLKMYPSAVEDVVVKIAYE